jgi:hypothetical protein
VALAAGAFACSRDAPVTTRSVTLHAPSACAVSSSAFVQYFELGDFEPTAPTTGHLAGDVGDTLSEIDPWAKALVVDATQESLTWSGVAPVASSGNVDVLLLPALSSCALSASPGARSGAVVAPIPGDLALVVGGGPAGQPAPSTYVANLTTGVLAPLEGPDLGTPRAGATVTAFGSGALVAGGVDTATQAVASTAETFAPGSGFDQQHPILLSEPRADHGAVVLAGGQTLLVGGVGEDGKTVLGSMDRIDPTTNTAQEQNVAVLAVPRRAPQVLLLASGEVLVAGGFDGSGNAVSTVEWFSADASQPTKRASSLVAGSARSFVALSAGGALAVVAPPPDAPSPFDNVWVIDADGAFEAATPLPDVTAPILFPGAGGAPVLWTGAGSASGSTGGRWLRWQPWLGSFGDLGVLDATPADVSASNGSGDPGLALWLDATSSAFTMLRFDTRGPYSTLDGPLVATTSDDVAPDRLAAAGVASFDPSTGLTLGPGASAFVTDRTYAGVTVAVDAPTGEPAMLVLRDQLGVELEVGGVGCPGALAKTGPASTLQVQRSGAAVTWSLSTGAEGTCPTGVASDARLSIGVRAPGDVTESVVRSVTVTRVGP